MYMFWKFAENVTHRNIIMFKNYFPESYDQGNFIMIYILKIDYGCVIKLWNMLYLCNIVHSSLVLCRHKAIFDLWHTRNMNPHCLQESYSNF